MIIIYVKDDCWKCKLLREWLKRYNFPFEERDVSNTEVLSDLITRYPSAMTLPILEVEGHFLGGVELERWMEEIESLH